MKNLKHHVITALTVLIFLMPSHICAVPYVSYNGKFYIQYPEDWLQVPYLTADMFLARSGSSQSALDYEAVFAPKSSSPFFTTDYLILTLDTLEWLYDYQIDSVVDEMIKTFGKDMEYFPSWDQPTDLKSNTPVYDKNNKILTVINDVVSGDRIVKKNMMVKKFHDKGIANFYFYAPDSTFEQSKKVFHEIVNSFGTENINQAVPKETGKVSDDIKNDELSFRKMLIPIGAALLILIILLIRLRKTKTRNQSE